MTEQGYGSGRPHDRRRDAGATGCELAGLGRRVCGRALTSAGEDARTTAGETPAPRGTSGGRGKNAGLETRTTAGLETGATRDGGATGQTGAARGDQSYSGES
jgi:hypothetical protein